MKFKRFFRDNVLLIIFILLLAAAVVLFSIIETNFFTGNNLRNLLRYISQNIFAAFGLTFVVILGHNDLSFGQVGCLSAMVTSYLVSIGQNFVLAIIVGLAVGALWGLMNGVLIARFKLPDMVATIGSGAIAFGLAYVPNGGNYIFAHFLDSGILNLNNARPLGIPLPVIMLVVIFAICYYFLTWTSFGRRIYAVGDNTITSAFSGIKVSSFIVIAYLLSGLLASLAAIIMTAALGRGQVKIGVELLLPAYTMVFLGRAIFKRTSISGTLFASVFISVVINGFTLLNAPFYITNLILSITLLFALVLSNLLNSKLKLSE